MSTAAVVPGHLLRPGDIVRDGNTTRTVADVTPRFDLSLTRRRRHVTVVAVTWADDEPDAAPSLASSRQDWHVLNARRYVLVLGDDPTAVLDAISGTAARLPYERAVALATFAETYQQRTARVVDADTLAVVDLIGRTG